MHIKSQNTDPEVLLLDELQGSIAMAVRNVKRVLFEEIKQVQVGEDKGTFYRQLSIATQDSLIVMTLTAKKPKLLSIVENRI